MKPSVGRFRRLRDHLRASRDGKRDGLLGIPAADESTPPPALVQITQRAQEALAELRGSVASDDARRRDSLGAAERDHRAAETDADDAAKAVAAAEQRRQIIDVRRDTFAAQPVDRGPKLSHRVYAVAIFAILLAEFPLNAIAFRLFGEAEVLTWVMTASLAITLVLCAHGLGTFLRQVHPSMAERRWVVVLIALPVLTIVAIAVIRARYLTVEAGALGVKTLGPVVGSAAFLVINLLVYTGATMLSYLAHAPRDGLGDQAGKAAEKAERELTSAQGRLADASRRARTHEEQLSKGAVSSEEALGVVRARGDEVTAYYRGLMAAYCKANLRARGNPQVPAALRELPAIELPSVLREAVTSAEISDNGAVSAATVRAVRENAVEAHG